MADPDIVDCLVIGAGPAGLVAATYLTRFHRRIEVVDGGASRARWIPSSHNCPGFPFGVSGDDLLAKLRTQAEGYGAPITPGRIRGIERDGDGFVALDEQGRAYHARFVVLATGIVDRMPTFEGGPKALEEAIRAGAIRLCAVCDGYEASDERIAVYGPADEAIRHAVFLRTFSRRVAVIRSEAGEPSKECSALAASRRRRGPAGREGARIPRRWGLRGRARRRRAGPLLRHHLSGARRNGAVAARGRPRRARRSKRASWSSTPSSRPPSMVFTRSATW